MAIPQPVEIEGVKSQVETSLIAANGSDTSEDSAMQELEEDSIAVRRPMSEVKSPSRYVDCLAEVIPLIERSHFA